MLCVKTAGMFWKEKLNISSETWYSFLKKVIKSIETGCDILKNILIGFLGRSHNITLFYEEEFTYLQKTS